MRLILLSPAVCACAALACAHPAYGPSGDVRLETAVSDGDNLDGAKATEFRCAELKPKYDEAKNPDRAEGERMQALMDVYVATKERSSQIEDAIARNPDLLYSRAAEVIKVNVDECRSFLADVRGDFDRFVRDVTDLPVIKEIQGNKDVARIDLAVVRDAIAALDPEDKDVLMKRVEAAEKKVESAKPAPASKQGKKR